MFRIWKSRTLLRKLTLILIAKILVILLIILGRNAEYLVSEFVYCRHGFLQPSNTNLNIPDPKTSETDTPPKHKQQKYRGIPNHLHQIFFFETDDVLPKRLENAQTTWKLRNPGYGYTLWNKTSILELIRRDYPYLLELYTGYGHWVRRADMARYIVMHRYGGWYIDIDIRCKKGVQDLSASARSTNKSLVVRWTEPSGCSNDFIGVTPQHPFFMHVLLGMFESNRWYVFPYAQTMFSTGPMFMWGRMMNYPYSKPDVHWVFDHSQYFDFIHLVVFSTLSPMFMWGRMMNYPYSKRDVHWVFDHSQYFDLIHGSSWHSWDGLIVWYFFKHRGHLRLLLLVSVITLICLWVKRRSVTMKIRRFAALCHRTRSKLMLKIKENNNNNTNKGVII